MPAIAPPAKVLVTGANGFIAMWVVKDLLDRGYTVRGTVRSEEKGAHVLKAFKPFADAGKLELAIVPDITAQGAFDEAIKGMDAIEHTASPFHLSGENPEDYIVPSVKGTLSILESAAKSTEKHLRRIVICSSCAAISDSEDLGVVNESEWNERDTELIKEKGKEAEPLPKYRASKSLGEKAAWDFYNARKSTLSWDMVSINPSFVFGPCLHEVDSPTSLNFSNSFFFNMIFSGTVDPASLEGFQSECVDVRDVSLAHVRAIEIPEAADERFINSAYGFVWQDFLDAVNDLKTPGLSVAMGQPGQGRLTRYKMKYDHSKSERILGLKYLSKHALAKAMVHYVKEKGWPKVAKL